jgi:hypothetical protein
MEDLQIESAVVEQVVGEDKSQHDTPDAPIPPSEKKRLHWSGKTCKSGFTSLSSFNILDTDLAPLTTVGNLVGIWSLHLTRCS